jgi:hypothetical protein
LLHDEAIGAYVALDEIGRILPAREWSKEDEIEQLVFEIHRHHGLDIGYACQSPSQVSASLRRLTGEWIYPYRIGIDPSKLLKAGKKPHWWQKPLAFHCITYFPDPSDESGMPRILHKKLAGGDKEEHNAAIPMESHWIPYNQYVADMYDTTERIYTDAIQLEIEERLSTAKDRLTRPQWEVHEGHTTGSYTRLQRARDDEEIRARRQRNSKRIRTEIIPEDPYAGWDLSKYLEGLQRDAKANEASLARTGQSTGTETVQGTVRLERLEEVG